MKYTIIDLSDSSNYELVEELTKYFSNPILVTNVEKGQIIHSVDTIIMRNVDKITTSKN